MDVVEVVPTLRAVRVHLRRRRPAAADRARARRCGCGPTTRSAGRCAAVDGPVQREGRPAVRQPADRAVLRRGRRARGHPGPALRRHGAGPRLGRLGGDPVLRRPDQHRPGRRRCRTRCRTPPGSTSWTGRANTVTFAARHSDLRDRPARRADARHRRRRARPAARCAARWCPTASAATWTPRRCAPGTTCFLRRQRRGRAVLGRRRPLPPGRGRGLRHRRRGRHDDDADRRADQGRCARRGRGSRTTPTG